MSRNVRDDKNGRFGERAAQLTMLAKLAILAIFCQFRHHNVPHDVKDMWSFTGGGCLPEVRPQGGLNFWKFTHDNCGDLTLLPVLIETH